MAREGGEKEAKERTTRKTAIVLDTNIIISSLIKPGGFTRRVILLLEDQAGLYAPKTLLEELAKKTKYLARKKRVSSIEQRHPAHPTPIKRPNNKIATLLNPL